jgi:hypothetical protein
VLALPNFSKEFIIDTDASDKGIGAFLLQGYHPLVYLRKSFAPKQQALSTYEECLAILLAVDKWRSYLQHVEFGIKTDQHALLNLTEQRLTTPWQHKVLTKLLALQFRIIYKKGVENKVDGALYRNPSLRTSSLKLNPCVSMRWLMVT